jgi:hypothetical protein
MAQKTWVTGEAIVASDINTYLTGEGGAWTTWTPTLQQAGVVTATVTHAVYGRWGRLIIASFRLTATGAGSANFAVQVSLPVTAARSAGVLGTGVIFDTSATLSYTGNAVLSSTTALQFEGQGGGVSPNTLGSTGSYFTAALAAGDVVTATITYEAAS